MHTHTSIHTPPPLPLLLHRSHDLLKRKGQRTARVLPVRTWFTDNGQTAQKPEDSL